VRTQLDVVIDAIGLVRPSIDRLFERTNRQELHIVVMDPRIKPWEGTFEEALLHEASIGDPAAWTIRFDELARNKARQAWRSRSANIGNQLIHPASLRDDDVLFFGSFVYGDIVVACSGVQQWYDMLISGWIALAIEQLTMHEYQSIKADDPGRRTFGA